MRSNKRFFLFLNALTAELLNLPEKDHAKEEEEDRKYSELN